MTIWVEKYRPKIREDIVGNHEVIDSIFALVDSGEMTSMIFESSTPGVGKTSTARVIAHKLFGENIRANFLDANASDERGIDFIKDDNGYWEFQYNSMSFITKYNPLELNDTKVNSGLMLGNYKNQVLSYLKRYYPDEIEIYSEIKNTFFYKFISRDDVSFLDIYYFQSCENLFLHFH